MPIYTYKCNDCSTRFDIFHKTHREENLIVCPSCNSESSTKIMSAANIGSMSNTKQTAAAPTCPAYGNGCSSGMCGLK